MGSGAAGIRVRWAAPEPRRVRDVLERLGFVVTSSGERLMAHLANASIAIEPSSRHGPAHGRSSWGRIVGVGPPAGRGRSPSSVSAGLATAPSLLGIGWATVDLERAIGEFEAGDDPKGRSKRGSDEILGARFATLDSATLPGVAIVFLEPVTEGRLAGSLVAGGEGPVALYLRRARGHPGSGITRSRAAIGPFGPERLVLGGPVAGPHLLLVRSTG
jgi:hypothetical protein